MTTCRPPPRAARPSPTPGVHRHADGHDGGLDQPDHRRRRGPRHSGAVPKGIYVGWNVDFTEPSGSLNSPVNVILIAASGDGGKTFTTAQYAGQLDDGGTGSNDGADPQIFFTQGTVTGSTRTTAVPGGQINIVSTGDGLSGSTGATIEQSQPDGGVAANDVAASETFTGTTGSILDASPGGTVESWTLNTTPNANDPPGTTILIINTSANPNPPNGAVITFTASGEQVTIKGTSGDTWTLTGTGLADAEPNGAQITFTTGTGTSTPNTSQFTDKVTAASFPTDFTTIDDLEVTLDLTEPNMNQVSIVLIPPTGSDLEPITLLSNLTNDANQATNLVGLNGANLGVLTDVVNGTTVIHNVGTVFDDDAPRVITDGTAAAPWIGHFEPSDLSGDGTVTVQVTAVFRTGHLSRRRSEPGGRPGDEQHQCGRHLDARDHRLREQR